MAEKRKIDFTGRRSDRLIVTGFAYRKNGRDFWHCLCDCGNTIIVVQYNLQSRNTRSCGCLLKEILSITKKTHGWSNQNTPEYRAWCAARGRCNNPKSQDYPNWGGRGIVFCDRWSGEQGFENFLSDVGKRPSRFHSLERIDVNGNYEPSNCKWATNKEQANNRRTKRIENFSDKEIQKEFLRRNLDTSNFFPEGIAC